MELSKDGTGLGSKVKAAVMILVALTFGTIWALAFTQSANAAVVARAASVSVSHAAPVAVRAAPVTPSYHSTPVRRAAPVTPVTHPTLYGSKSGKNCNLEQNKKLKECIDKKR